MGARYKGRGGGRAGATGPRNPPYHGQFSATALPVGLGNVALPPCCLPAPRAAGIRPMAASRDITATFSAPAPTVHAVFRYFRLSPAAHHIPASPRSTSPSRPQSPAPANCPPSRLRAGIISSFGNSAESPGGLPASISQVIRPKQRPPDRSPEALLATWLRGALWQPGYFIAQHVVVVVGAGLPLRGQEPTLADPLVQ